MIEFDCEHCGVHVYAFALERVPSPALCLQCAFVASLDLPPDAADALRSRLLGQPS